MANTLENTNLKHTETTAKGLMNIAVGLTGPRPNPELILIIERMNPNPMETRKKG